MNKILVLIVVFFTLSSVSIAGDAKQQIPTDVRCKICGMFVAKYPAWITKIIFKDKSIEYFDGVKDMMVYYFNPKKFGERDSADFEGIWVKDYYSLNWLEARKAFFVTGSDVYGPMGHEFIAFSSKEAAISFSKDHHGKQILAFDEISLKKVETMRVGNRMK